jgi:hypothetical protein
MAEQGVHPRFFKKACIHEGKSKEAGREVCVDKDYIEIRVAGVKDIHVAPVTDKHKARFPDEWAAYERGSEEPQEGTPVNRWPQLTPSQVETLLALNIRTVENMATAPDFALQKLGMGARKLQDDARKFLSLAQHAADVGQLDELRDAVRAKDAALVAQGEQIAELQTQMADMMAKLAAATETAPIAPVEEAPKRRRKEPA